MTNEQINKAAEEFCEKRRLNSRGYPPKEWFIAGVAFANNHWQEKTRWIPITERLPKNQNIVLLKTENDCFLTGYLHGKKSGFIVYGMEAYESIGEVTHWREIE